jgi:hypothetical protein
VRRGSRSGLTLIEVVITTVLLTLLIVPIYGLLYQSRQSVAEGRYMSVARLAAEAEVERIRGIAQRSEGEFAALATYLTNNPTFMVRGLPRWIGTTLAPYAAENGNNNGRIRVFLDEGPAATSQFLTNTGPVAHDNYFACPPFTTVPNPAWQTDLDNSLKATGTAFAPVALTGNYRVLPIRVEVYWGHRPLVAGTNPGDLAPKVALNAVVAPKFHFRRG